MSRPVRILQVVSEMGPTGGGVEVWLMQVLRHLDREQFQMDFLVHTPLPKAFDDEVRALGGRVLPCVRPLYLWKYPFAFRRVLRKYGPYDVVHSHVLFGGLVMRLARLFGVPARIAHSHSDVDGFRVDGDPLRGPFVRYTTRWARRDATRRLACSRRAGVAMFGDDACWDVLHYGIDLAPFETAVDRAAVRAEFGILSDELVLGHIGRFQEQKNHFFVLDVFRELVRRDARARLVLVGDGPLRLAVKERVHRLNLADRIHFLGVRDDVPRLMRVVLDVFVLPSRYEGLPLVGIEAQAAGLPCVLSDTITKELDVVPGLVTRLPITKPAAIWADAVRAAQNTRQVISPRDALAAVRGSSFDMRAAIDRLEQVYRDCINL